jgi:hypothetical protein
MSGTACIYDISQLVRAGSLPTVQRISVDLERPIRVEAKKMAAGTSPAVTKETDFGLRGLAVGLSWPRSPA